MSRPGRQRALFYRLFAVSPLPLPFPSDPQFSLMRRVDEAAQAAIVEVGLSEEEFQNCLMKYQGDPRFLNKLAASQQAQEEAKMQLLGA